MNRVRRMRAAMALAAWSVAAFASAAEAPARLDPLIARARAGDPVAQNDLGSALQAEKRYEDAFPWYQRAASRGMPLAINNLAYLYELGLGVSQDRKKAFELYGRAADLGSAEAMWNLANMHGAGQVGPVDLVMACTWAVRAKRFALPGQERVVAEVDRVMPRLEKSLAPADLQSCRREGQDWTLPPQAAPGSAPSSTATGSEKGSRSSK